MEFNFKSINQRSSSSSSPYLSSSYPLPPIPNPTLNPNHNHIYPNYPPLNHPFPQHDPSSSSSPYFTPFPVTPFPVGFGALDMRQREIEKERIRAEILAEEAMRRKILEEEVRREIMIERDRFLRYGSTHVVSKVPLLTNEETDRFQTGFATWRETRFEGLEPLPFRRSPRVDGIGNGNGEGSSCGAALKDIKSIDKEANKEKVILAKPDVNWIDLKRKTTPASGGDVEVKEVKSVSVKKQKTKTEDEWSCALCQVTTTSEQALNEHLKGKKHLAREKGLVTQKVGFGDKPKPNLPNKTSADTSQSDKLKGRGKGKSTKVRENPTQKASGTDKVVSDEQNCVERSTSTAKRYRFWCEMCKVGAHTKKVMSYHTRGKKHLANLNKLNQPSNIDTVMEENKSPDFANVVIKRETVIKVVEKDVPQTENEDKVVVDNVGDDG